MDELCGRHKLLEAYTSGRLQSPDSIRLVTLPVRCPLMLQTARCLQDRVSLCTNDLLNDMPSSKVAKHMRFGLMQDVGADMRSGQDEGTTTDTRQQASAAVLEFVSALHRDALALSTLPWPGPVCSSQSTFVAPSEQQDVHKDREVPQFDDSGPFAKLEHEDGSALA